MNTGAYQLRIQVRRDCRIPIGRKGSFRFQKGLYIYTGSSMTNLDKRVARHRSRQKKLYWHIDYLLAHPAVRLIGVDRFESDTKQECALNLAVQQTPGARAPVRGFGAGDCRAGCIAHLFLLPDGEA